MAPMKADEGSVPVIDLFAGPGGLGEGFSSVEDSTGDCFYRLALSIEKDDFAVRTLRLRSFFRSFDHPPSAYYDFLKVPPKFQLAAMAQLFKAYPEAARKSESEVMQATLGRTRWRTVFGAIDSALAGLKPQAPWVLIGGPPCQAYSMVGRARMTGKKETRERARLHRLYRHYLQILDRYKPPVFVMENVKGLLSAKVDGQPIFQRILKHLEGPHPSGVTYEAVPLVVSQRETWKSQMDLWDSSPEERVRDHRSFLIRAEDFGIPQARHRVIVLGIEQGLFERVRENLPGLIESVESRIGVSRVISDLPRLRSGLSKASDSDETWRATIGKVRHASWLSWLRRHDESELADRIIATVDAILEETPRLNRGSNFINRLCVPDYRPDWFSDSRLPGTINHESRSHIESDLSRYLFAACYAQLKRRSAKLQDFPTDLLPEHANLSTALESGLFNDRFRVQIERDGEGRDVPGRTVTSHISRDGHSFIHFDPTQSRSLTVREGARIQTFPDNYAFLGPRTEQYRQVGNAVPPLLACQIAETVAKIVHPGSRLRSKGTGKTASAREAVLSSAS